MGVSQSTVLLAPGVWQPVLPLQLNRLSFICSPLYGTVYLSLQPSAFLSNSVHPPYLAFGGGNPVTQFTGTVPGNLLNLSASFWVNLIQTTSGPGFIFQYATQNSPVDRIFKLQATNNSTTLDYTIASQTGTTTADIGVWDHFVFTYGPGLLYNLYKNGVNILSGGAGGTVQTLTPIILGSGGGNWLDAWYLTDVRIYNVTLSQADVTALYNSGVPSYSAGSTSNLVAWYKCNDGAGNSLLDISGNGLTTSGQNLEWIGGGSTTSQVAYGITLGTNFSMPWVDHGEMAWQQWYAYWNPGSNTQPFNPLTLCEWTATMHLGDLPYSPNKAPPDFLPATFRIQQPLPPRLKALAPRLAEWMRSLRQTEEVTR